MGKVQKTQSLDQSTPDAVRCAECNGSGSVRPLFYEQICPSCEGAGITHEDGSPLEPHQAYRVLWRRMDRLEKALKNAKSPSADEIDRYAGASSRLGGRFVMD